ncbi:MAG: hypothetical protein KDM91_19080, partial [Verrucomicrobiae bacterium]|nr:hypothetical protein [Verrucomicrobiae bacterium]
MKSSLKSLLILAVLAAFPPNGTEAADFSGLTKDHLGGSGGQVVVTAPENNYTFTVSGAPDWISNINGQYTIASAGQTKTITWTYAKNWIPDGVTGERSATLNVAGDSAGIVQTGIDNTYFYDPFGTNVSVEPYSSGFPTLTIAVWSAVPFSPVQTVPLDGEWGSGSNVYNSNPGEPWISVASSGVTSGGPGTYFGREFRCYVSIRYGDNTVFDGVTDARNAKLKIKAPDTDGVTYTIDQPGVDNTYVYDPSPETIELRSYGSSGSTKTITVWSAIPFCPVQVITNGDDWGDGSEVLSSTVGQPWISVTSSGTTGGGPGTYLGREYRTYLTLRYGNNVIWDAVTPDRIATF